MYVFQPNFGKQKANGFNVNISGTKIFVNEIGVTIHILSVRTKFLLDMSLAVI